MAVRKTCMYALRYCFVCVCGRSGKDARGLHKAVEDREGAKWDGGTRFAFRASGTTNSPCLRQLAVQ